MADRIWTVSNSISVLRAVLIVPLGYCLLTEFEGNRLWAAVIIAVAIASDFLDGYLARRLHQVSEFGKIIDPLADKLSIAAVVIFLVLLGDIPVWFGIVVLLRDVLILAGGLYIRRKKKIIAQSNWPGKIAVTFVAVYLLLSVLQSNDVEPVREAALWGSVATMGLSLGVYARRLFIGRTVEQSE